MLRKFLLILTMHLSPLMGTVQLAVIRNILDPHQQSSRRLPAQERMAQARRMINENKIYTVKKPIYCPHHSAACTDLILTTVTPIDPLSPERAQVLQEAVQELKQYADLDLDQHFKLIETNLAKMEQAGLFKPHASKDILVHGFKHFFSSLKPNDPRKNPREFALNVIKYTGLVAFHAFTAGAFVEAQLAASFLFKAHQLMSLDVAQMTDEQIIEVVAEELAAIAWDIAVAKAAPVVQGKAVKLGSNLLKKVKSNTHQYAVIRTTEGGELKILQPLEDTNFLKNGADKKIADFSAHSLRNETKYISKTINGRTYLEIQHPVTDSVRTGSALKTDPYHALDNCIDNFVRDACKFSLTGADGITRDLYQLEGSLGEMRGIFEWIVDPRPEKGVTHRLFIKGGIITGKPNMIGKK